VDASLSGGVDGTTYLALLATDYKSDKAYLVEDAPAHGGHNFAAWKAVCVDNDKKVQISGTVTFRAEGLEKAQVETAAKIALAAALDVNAELISITVTLAVDGSRRLSDIWKIDYAVVVPESKGEAVEQMMVKISEGSLEFQEQFENALNQLPGASAWPQRKTVQFGTASKPEKQNTTIGSNAGSRGPEGTVVDGTTSQWLSTGVAVLVGLTAVIMM